MIEVDKTYMLDDMLYRCDKVIDEKMAVFQKVNEDGSDCLTFNNKYPQKVDFNGRHIYFSTAK